MLGKFERFSLPLNLTYVSGVEIKEILQAWLRQPIDANGAPANGSMMSPTIVSMPGEYCNPLTRYSYSCDTRSLVSL